MWPDLQAALEQVEAAWLGFEVRADGAVRARTADGTELLLHAQGFHLVATAPLGGTREPIPICGETAANVLDALLTRRFGPVSTSPDWSE